MEVVSRAFQVAHALLGAFQQPPVVNGVVERPNLPRSVLQSPVVQVADAAVNAVLKVA